MAVQNVSVLCVMKFDPDSVIIAGIIQRQAGNKMKIVSPEKEKKYVNEVNMKDIYAKSSSAKPQQNKTVCEH